MALWDRSVVVIIISIVPISTGEWLHLLLLSLLVGLYACSKQFEAILGDHNFNGP